MRGGDTIRCYKEGQIELIRSDRVNNINKSFFNTSDNLSRVIPSIATKIVAHEGIPDTAATKHYITEDALNICNNVANTKVPYVTVADSQVMAPTKKVLLPL